MSESYDVYEFEGHEVRVNKCDRFVNSDDMDKIDRDRTWKKYISSNDGTDYTYGNALLEFNNANNVLSMLIYCHTDFNIHKWIHPKLAIHFATWIKPTFGLTMIDWVYTIKTEPVSNELKAEVAIHKDTIKTLEKHVNVSECDVDNLCNLNDKLEAEIGHHKTTIRMRDNQIRDLKRRIRDMDMDICLNNTNSDYRCAYCECRIPYMYLMRHPKECGYKQRHLYRR